MRAVYLIAPMPEVQSHGFSFEEWVRNEFFDGYTGSYMQKWDIAPSHNRSESVPAEFRHLPVSIKTAKLGAPIGLGDALRQRKIDHSFLMIVGFWRQKTPREKWITEIDFTIFTPESWEQLWGGLDLDPLEEIDQMVKNRAEHYSVVRKKAKAWKAQPNVRSSPIVINPKIDSKTQRRVQCSLPASAFWRLATQDASSGGEVCLWGKPFPNPILSSPRVFNK